MTMLSNLAGGVESTFDYARTLTSGAGFQRAKAISKEVAAGMHLKTGGFALQAATGAVAGGAAGYGLDSRDRGRGALRGAGLGVLGMVGLRGVSSARSSALAKEGWTDMKAYGRNRWDTGLLQSRLGLMEAMNPSTGVHAAEVIAPKVGKRDVMAAARAASRADGAAAQAARRARAAR
jgi:hypothetical protein